MYPSLLCLKHGPELMNKCGVFPAWLSPFHDLSKFNPRLSINVGTSNIIPIQVAMRPTCIRITILQTTDHYCVGVSSHPKAVHYTMGKSDWSWTHQHWSTWSTAYTHALPTCKEHYAFPFHHDRSCRHHRTWWASIRQHIEASYGENDEWPPSSFRRGTYLAARISWVSACVLEYVLSPFGNIEWTWQCHQH